jgi:putative tryptophan/tyrosine transport system substrate-binding protein
MRRREFLGVLAGAAAWPLAANAQTTRLPTVGLLAPGTVSTHGAWFAVFARRLRELGWIEGQTVTLAYRWADGHPERYPELATELLQINVDVIFTTVPTVPTLKSVTSVVPIVFALGSDPVGGGLVASLSRPGGNVTGLSTQATDLTSKRVELLREIVPNLRLLAILGNIDNAQIVLEMHGAEDAARKLGIEAVLLGVRRPEDIAPSLQGVKDRAQALYVCIDPLTNINRVALNDLARDARLPTMHDLREPVAAGGLMSYGPDFPDQFARAANIVDKILRGAKAGDIPVEQADKFALVVNLKTARALGLVVPETFLSRADEVIE